VFAWLINHQPAVLFSKNKPTTNISLLEQISTSHQPNEQAVKDRRKNKRRKKHITIEFINDTCDEITCCQLYIVAFSLS
jgi:hypothetical protein